MKGETVISNVFLSRTTNEPTFSVTTSVATPIWDDGQVIGVIFGMPNLAKFSEKFVSPVKVSDTGYLVLFDSSGMIFAHKSADEVRNLAQRAADAAKDVSSLIENTIINVRKGSELTTQTQYAFLENMDISGKVSNLVDEIASASREQAQGISQISKAVAEMDRVVQQTAASAEGSASASEEMNTQAREMKGYVDDLIGLIGNVHQEMIVDRVPAPCISIWKIRFQVG